MILLFRAACATSMDAANTPSPSASSTDTIGDDAAAGVENSRLRSLLMRHWADFLETNPVDATQLGDHRFDDRIRIRTNENLERERHMRRTFLEEAESIAKEERLFGTDATTVELFIELVRAEIRNEVCAFETWSLSPQRNPITEWNELAIIHPVRSPRDGENLVARYRQVAAAVDAEITNLRRGIASGAFANAASTRRVLEAVRGALETPSKDWAMVEPAKAEHADWPVDVAARFRIDVESAIESSVRPAFERYASFIERDILPHARPADRVGIGALPFGSACYAARIAEFTTLQMSAAELHEAGLAEIRRIDDAIRALGARVLGISDLGAILTKLRSDRSLHFASSAEIEDKAKRALAAAKARIPDYFGTLPKADCVVLRIPDHEAPYSYVAYYRPPVPDGSRPGEYRVNASAPTTRTRYEAEALAFHESIPGHHLQIAIAQELPALPAFRKHIGMTAFVEGWALYAERLADEMGLYSGDLDRIGMLSFEAWRAARLVVDTGIHAMGWSRERAAAFLVEHTALAPNNIDNEVDRYIVWPGQALAYKTGQLEILRLRKLAEDRLGPAFRLPTFHDAVLSRGAVSLPILAREIRAWVEGFLPPEKK